MYLSIEPLLQQLGFPLLKHGDGSVNPHIRNAHRYYVVGAGYQTVYHSLANLRPELKLELIQRQPSLIGPFLAA